MNLPIRTTIGKTVYDAKPFKESWIGDQYWIAKRRKGEPDPKMEEPYSQYLYSNGTRVFYIGREQGGTPEETYTVCEEFNSDLPLMQHECASLEKAVRWLEDEILSKMDDVVFHDCPENEKK